MKIKTILNKLRDYEFISLVIFEPYEDESSGNIYIEVLDNFEIKPKELNKILNMKYIKSIRFLKYGISLKVEGFKENDEELQKVK